MIRSCERALRAVSAVLLLGVVSPVRADECGGAVVAGPTDVGGGFNRAESCFWHEDSQSFYVANIGTQITPGPAAGQAPDGNGFMSKLDADFNVVALHWIDGLNSPKGMGSYKGLLCVSDVGATVGTGRIVCIAIDKGKIVDEVLIPATVKFPNDVAIDQKRGLAYLTDFGNGPADGSYNIWKITLDTKPRTATLFATLTGFGRPNGIAVRKGAVMVGTSSSGGTAVVGGYVLQLSDSGAVAAIYGDVDGNGHGDLGNIDGLEWDGKDAMILTDNQGLVADASRLIRLDLDTNTYEVLTPGTRFADIAFRRDDCTIVIPQLEFATTMEVYRLGGDGD